MNGHLFFIHYSHPFFCGAMAEVLIYGYIGSYSAEAFIQELNASKGPLTVRINSNGGDPEAAFGMIAKYAEYAGKKIVKVDGKAHSSAAYFVAFADEVEALDCSQFILHRAAYPDWIESDPELMTGDRLKSLKIVNDKLRAALEAKCDGAKLKALKNVTFDEMFAVDTRIDVLLTADEAKAIGLVNTIKTLTPEKSAEVERLTVAAAEKEYGIPMAARAATPPAANTPQKTKPDMSLTKEELKAQNPALYAAIVNEGAEAERDRVGALMAFIDADPETVKKSIKEGKALTQTMMAELTVKMAGKTQLTSLKVEGAAEVETAEVETKEKNAKQKQLETFEADLDKKLGLKK